MANRDPGAIREWFGQLWADLKAGTDASLLGVGRMLGLLYGPIDRRVRIDESLRKSLQYRLSPHVRWKHALGSITYFLFIVLVVTGVLLAFHYRPSVQEAYPSIQHIVSDVTLGWLVRDIHVWSAGLIVVVVLLHLARVFFDVAYKPPRETNWLAGMLLLLVVLAFGATGYLLPWDQWSYWVAVEVLSTYEKLPAIGPAVTSALTGDVMVSGATLSRYFALHVIVLPWIAFGLLGLHFGLLRRHGIAPPRREPASAGPGLPFYPNHLLRSFATAVVVAALVITLAVLYPRPIGEPADPYQLPADLVTTWGPVKIGLAVVRYLGPWGVAGFVALGLGLVILPILGRDPDRRISRQPVAVALVLAFYAALLLGWAVGGRIRSIAPEIAPAVQAPAGAAVTPSTDQAPALPAGADTAGISSTGGM